MAEGYPIRFFGEISPIAIVNSTKQVIPAEGSYTETFPPKSGDMILELKNGVRAQTRLVFSRFLRDEHQDQVWGTRMEI